MDSFTSFTPDQKALWEVINPLGRKNIEVLQCLLLEEDPRTGGELAELYGINRTSIYAQCKRLVDAGVAVSQKGGRRLGSRASDCYMISPNLSREDLSIVCSRIVKTRIKGKVPRKEEPTATPVIERQEVIEEPAAMVAVERTQETPKEIQVSLVSALALDVIEALSKKVIDLEERVKQLEGRSTPPTEEGMAHILSLLKGEENGKVARG